MNAMEVMTLVPPKVRDAIAFLIDITEGIRSCI